MNVVGVWRVIVATWLEVELLFEFGLALVSFWFVCFGLVFWLVWLRLSLSLSLVSVCVVWLRNVCNCCFNLVN